MVKNCCVLGCTSNTKRNPAISFFRFPTDTTLASMWLQLIGRPDFKPSQYSVICQLHFTREDFTSGSHHYPITGIGGQRKRLKTKAIPTQNLHGCTNPELLAEMQMRAKNTIPHKPLKSIMGSNKTMVNAHNGSDSVQLQQLLTTLMPALFGNDNNEQQQVQCQIMPSTSIPTVFTSSNGATPLSTHGPIISIPTTLQSIPLSNTTLIPSTQLHDTVLKNESVASSDHAIFKISNGLPHCNGSTNGNYSLPTEDLYTELQNSLLALKNNMVQDIAQDNTPMESNPAYIIDVDTYQKLMETVSLKSEKCIQTDKDLILFSLEAENKQLKEQLSQYEVAFNSLINWTEGSLKTEPVSGEKKLVEGKLIE